MFDARLGRPPAGGASDWRRACPETLTRPNEGESASWFGSWPRRSTERLAVACGGDGKAKPFEFWKSAPDRSTRRRHRPSCDRLEERSLMTGIPGYDYVLTGYSWQNPARITYSIAPDGVFWDHGTNVLNAAFNAKFGASGTWERQIALALATWESVANINLVPVQDGPYDFNTLGNAQGDPRFGDIRFGGYAFANNTTTLAETYFPPPNGSTAAGDVEINTALGFNIGSSYDLYSVLLHETGHSLGLNHPTNPVGGHVACLRRSSDGLAGGRHCGDSGDLWSANARRLSSSGARCRAWHRRST